MAHDQTFRPRYSPQYSQHQQRKPFLFYWGRGSFPPHQEEQALQKLVVPVNLHVSDFKSIIEKYVKPYLKECITSFSSGQINKSLAQWEAIISDQTILQIVKGEKIEFIVDPPTQSV